MIIEDERGVQWDVQGGDPGARHVNRLKRHFPSMDYIVLPWELLAVEGANPADVPSRMTLMTNPLARGRLNDCMGFLRRN